MKEQNSGVLIGGLILFQPQPRKIAKKLVMKTPRIIAPAGGNVIEQQVNQSQPLQIVQSDLSLLQEAAGFVEAQEEV